MQKGQDEEEEEGEKKREKLLLPNAWEVTQKRVEGENGNGYHSSFDLNTDVYSR